MNFHSFSIPRQLLDKPRIVGSSPKVRAIFTRFVQSIPGEIDQMKRAVETSDWEKLVGLLHKFQGTAGGCGFSALMDETIQLQETVRAGQRNQTLVIELETLECLAKLSAIEFERLLPQEN